MRVAFFSNYLNHHQLPFCLAMDRTTNGQFTFVATKPIARRALGYQHVDTLRHLLKVSVFEKEGILNE